MADVEDLRIRAIELLLRHGYAGIAMSQIATDLGMSVRTLHRYFPTKADIVWGGIERSLDELRRGFQTVDERLPTIEAITEVVRSVFDDDTDTIAVTRQRLRAIATLPEVQSSHPETYQGWRDATVEYIARRLDVPVDDVVPRALGAVIQTTIMEALVWWAGRSDAESPTEVVTRALRGIATVSR